MGIFFKEILPMNIGNLLARAVNPAIAAGIVVGAHVFLAHPYDHMTAVWFVVASVVVDALRGFATAGAAE